jgi:hypothetical protein
MGKRVRILDEEPTIQGGNIFPVDLNTYQEVRRVTLDQIKNYVNSNVSGTSGSSGSSGVDGNFYGSSGSSGSGQHGSSGISGSAGTSGETDGTSGTSGTSGSSGSSGITDYNTDHLFWYDSGNTTLYVPYVNIVGMSISDITTAPTTASAGSVTNRYGGATNFLGNPVKWIPVNIGGVIYKLPLY